MPLETSSSTWPMLLHDTCGQTPDTRCDAAPGIGNAPIRHFLYCHLTSTRSLMGTIFACFVSDKENS